MKKLILILTCFLLSMGLAIGQNVLISGTVLDEYGEPVIGASIEVKGSSSIGTISDIEGRFSLEVPDSAQTLIVNSVGMKQEEVAVAPNLIVTLFVSDQLLDEVIVTGYGNFTKKTYTGSASTVGMTDMKDMPSETLQSRLAGTIAGVKVSANAGQPGGFTSMRIRGSGSISASNNPLYVIDGVPIFTGDISEFDYANSGTDPTALINPSDIESITVIKDAAAASLYGSRAANGVIIVTTKRGKAGKPVVSLKADWGASDFAIDWRPTHDGDTRREVLKLGLQNYYIDGGLDAETALIEAENTLNNSFGVYANKPKTGWVDWKDLLLRKNAKHSNYEFNINGGNEKTKFFASLGYMDQEGMSLQSEFERYTGRIGITHQSDRWSLDASSLISKAIQDRSNEGTSYASPIMTVYGIGGSPAYNPFNEDGSYATTGYPLGGAANPLASAVYNENKANMFRSLTSIKVGYRIWDNLILSERLSYDYLTNKEIVWWDGRSNDGKNYKGLNQTVISDYTTLSTQTQLNYQKLFNDAHNLNATFAFESEDAEYAYSYLVGYDFPNYTLREILCAAETSAETNKRVSRMLSFLTLVNYDYLNKYYISANLRRDGSSRLSSVDNSRWGNFFSVSGAWRISEELFFSPSIKSVLTDAKIRLSYGTNGNLPTNWYAYQGVYGFGYKYNGAVGSTETSIQNDNLKWEKNYVTNLGIDLILYRSHQL